MGNKIAGGAQLDTDKASPFLSQFAVFSDISIDEAKKLAENIFADDKDKEKDLTWSKYFHLLEAQLEVNRQRNDDCMRKFIHPATMNYVVTEKRKLKGKNLQFDQVSETNVKYTKNDYYTDDSASESSDIGGGYDEEKSVNKKDTNQVSKKLFTDDENTEVIHPAFIGNSWDSVENYERHKKSKIAERELRCRRAVEIARKFRTDAVDQMEKRIQIQQSQREKKMNDITNKFEKETNEIRLQYSRDSAGASNDLVSMMKDQHDQKLAIIQAAYDSEMGYLLKFHADKCKADDAQLDIRKGELRALVELMDPKAPLADQLERFARIELGRLSAALNDALNHVEKMKAEFMELRNDTLNELDIQNQNAAALKKNRELRSMLNVAETKLKEAIRSAKNVEDELMDAEALMQKAIDLRSIEEKLFPFFHSFQQPSTTKDKAFADKRQLTLGLLLLAKGSFHEKISSLLSIYNNNLPDRWDMVAIKEIFRENITVLQKLKFVQVVESDVSSLEEFLVRCFLELTLLRKDDIISMYELQQLILYSIIRLPSLCKLFQVGTVSPKTASFSVFQIYSMKAVSFLQLGTVSVMSVSHSAFLQSIRYRSKLVASQKRVIHDLAVACGSNDPYKVDYGLFLSKGMKKSSYRVPPLNNGRDTSLWMFDMTLRTEAVTKIQSMIRSFVARRKFERASLEAAYAEARQSALQLAKSKILKEFQQREGGKGIGKMKWDAEVRIQQAKFRAQGKNLSRSDTVMLMVEAAIADAQQLVQRRFQDILPTALVQAGKSIDSSSSRKMSRKISQNNSTKIANTISNTKLLTIATTPLSPAEEYFGFDISKFESSRAADVVNIDPEDTAGSDDIVSTVAVGSVQLKTVKDFETFYSDVLNKITISDAPNQWYQSTTSSIHGRGERLLHQMVRIYLGSAEYGATVHLAHILTLLHNSITTFKASELVSEFPSKRLLARYILHNEVPDLVEDFVQHFKFRRQRAQMAVSSLRKYCLLSDEVGRLYRLCAKLEQSVDEGMFKFYQNAIYTDSKAFTDYIDQKVANQAAARLSVAEVALIEYTSSLSTFKRFKSDQFRLSKAVQDGQRQGILQINSCQIAAKNIRVQRMAASLMADGDAAQGGKGFPELFDSAAQLTFSSVPENVRFNWWARYQGLEKAFPTSPNTYYKEMEHLLTDFTQAAILRAKILIKELLLDESSKTIPTFRSRPIDGRSNNGITGRGMSAGVDSVRRIFCVDNLFLEVCCDDDGFLNGNDEYAAKQAGKELLGAQLVHNAGIAKICAPLTVTVDYHGFRVLVTSKMPIDLPQVNDDGVIQNESQEIVHEMQKQGRFFINQSRVAHSYMKVLAQRLNLAEHLAKGTDDLSASSTFASNTKIYKGDDGQFYLRRCRNLVPRELPQATPHLLDTPRQNSVLWRFVRPELVRKLDYPLSTDVGLLSTFGVVDKHVATEEVVFDSQEVDTNVDFLTRSILGTQEELLSKVIPQFLNSLLKLEPDYLAIPWKQFVLSQEMHKAGINMRHLGYMRSFLWRDLPGKFNIFHNEKVIRSTEIVDQEVFSGDYLQLGVDTHTSHDDGQDQSQRKQQKHALLFEIGDMTMRKTRKFLPITVLHTGDSMFNIRARVGKLLEARQRRDIELLIVGEMVIRTMKQLVRYCWRHYVRKHRVLSPQFQRQVVCYHLNMLSSSEDGAGVYGSEILYNSIRERFGTFAVYASERTQLLDHIRPAIKVLIPRLCHMLGVAITPLSMSHFLNHPNGYNFQPNDIFEISERIKTSFPQLPLIRASNLSLLGDEVLGKNYSALVAMDKPAAFYKTSERKGATVAQNSGVLGSQFNGKISDGCLLYEDGPTAGEKFIKSIGFSPISESMIDMPFHKHIVPIDPEEPFSVEVFFSVFGGRDVARTIVDSGRYQISINRENKLAVVIFDGIHSMHLVLDNVSIVERQWYHTVVTFDGINLTTFVNGAEIASIDLVEVFLIKQHQFDEEHAKALRALAEEEENDKVELMESLQEQATTFFTTKEGQRLLKELAQQFLDKEEGGDEDQNGNIDETDAEHANLLRERKGNATKAAKELYLSQQHEAAVRALHERFKQMRLDLEDRKTRALDQGKLHSYQHLRVGASLPDANNRHGSAYFLGLISCIAIYRESLPREIVRAHYLASQRDCRRDAFRIFSDAVSNFAVAWKGYNGDIDAPHILDYLSVYSHALCQLFHAQYEEKVDIDRTIAKANLIQLIEVFRVNMMAGAIAEILRHLPREPDFADVVIEALLAIKQTDKNYLLAQGIVQDTQIIMIPFDFALITPVPRSFRALQAAAFLLQQVARDRKLAFAYSDAVDLHWIVELYSPAAIVSIALTAYEDGQFKILRIKNAELIEQWQLQLIAAQNEESKRKSQDNLVPAHVPNPFQSGVNKKRSNAAKELSIAAARPTTTTNSADKEQELCLLSDADVQTLAEHLPLLQGVDFSHCGRGLTETAIGELARFAQLRILILDFCAEVITDKSLVRLQEVAPQLEVLSLADLPLITDDGILKAFITCQRLSTLNLSGSIQITARAIVRILTQNKYLTTLGLSRLPITDRCLVNFADALSAAGATLHHLDLSFSADITDSGMLGFLSPSATPSGSSVSSSATSLAVAKLKTINLQSCQRLSWKSVARIAHCCWMLERLDVDDVYLLRDVAFVFDNRIDGRSQTQEEMLRQLTTLSVATCHDITDRALKELSVHCRQLRSLSLRDTGNFSDVGLGYLYDARLCPYSDNALAATLTDLNLAYAGRFTEKGLLGLLEQAPKLNRLDLSGLATLVNDDVIGKLAHLCPGIQSLGLAHCLQITDLAICHLAEHLWIEELNVEGCHKVTDDGIEVLAEACSGLRILSVKKARLVTERGIRFVQSTCRNLEMISSDI